MKTNKIGTAVSVTLACAGFLLLSSVAAAQSNNVKGVINGRNGATMTVQTQDSGNVTVVLTPATQVQQVQQNKATIQAQQQQIRAEQQQLQAEQQASAEHAAEIAANKAKIAAAIAAANKRFGELADYNILGETTVLFGNDQVTIEDQYKPQLLQLAQQAKGITAYIIQVKGYASKVGSAALNQRLSTERAENVTTFLEEQGNIPLTNILAPGAMGTSRQVAPDTTVEGQAENRRVVVRILQNKGIAGT